MDAGTLNVISSVAPETTVTLSAEVLPEGPSPEVVGLSVTVTLAGGIVPFGKPCPTTVTLVTPGSAALGVADVFSVISVTAPNRSELETSAKTSKGFPQRDANPRLFRMLFIVGPPEKAVKFLACRSRPQAPVF